VFLLHGEQEGWMAHGFQTAVSHFVRGHAANGRTAVLDHDLKGKL